MVAARPEPGTAAGSLFADRASLARGDDDDDGADDDADDGGTAADATAVASAGAAVAVAVAAAAVAAGTDTGTGIGIGTAATGTGTDIGDWTGGVFGAALPGPAVPYRWDDMYHQKPGLAVCLYVGGLNHSFSSFVSSQLRCGCVASGERLSFSRLPPLRLDPPSLHVFYGFSLSIRGVLSRPD